MIKMIFLIKRKTGMTHDEFRQYYESNHAKIAETHFKDLILDYRRNYPVSSTKNPVENAANVTSGSSDDLGFDAITQMTLKDQAALDEMLRRFASPELYPMIAADEKNFMDRSALTAIVCEEVISWTQ